MPLKSVYNVLGIHCTNSKLSQLHTVYLISHLTL